MTVLDQSINYTININASEDASGGVDMIINGQSILSGATI